AARRIGNGRIEADARIVDEHIDAAQRSDGLRRHPRDLGGDGYVGRDREGFAALAANFRGHVVQRWLATGRQRNPSAAPRKLQCDGPPDPARGSGYDRAGCLQPHELMLAATTEIRRLTPRGQLRDPVSTARTFLLGLAMDRHEASVLLVRLVLRLRLDRFDG